MGRLRARTSAKGVRFCRGGWLHRWVVFVAVGVVMFATAPVAAAQPSPSPMCAGRPATIVGTLGPDIMEGTPRADVIVTGDGNDKVSAKDGDDFVCTGNGDDIVDGGNGADIILTGDGNDKVSTGDGNDTIDGGRGRDIADAGGGFDRCQAVEFAAGCEQQTSAGETTVVASVGPCQPSLVLDADTPNAIEHGVAESGKVNYDLTLRNEPSGACWASQTEPTSPRRPTPAPGRPPPAKRSAVDSGVTVTGTLKVSTSHGGGDAATGVAMWLELPRGGPPVVVAPSSSGLISDGGPAPGGCPGGTAEGCAPRVGEVVGNVSYPTGFNLPVPSGGTASLDFQFFPRLEPADIDAIRAAGNTAKLAVAVTTNEQGIVIHRTTAKFANPANLDGISVKATLPSGATQTVAVPALPSGAQQDRPAAFTYTTRLEDPDTITARFVASATTPATASKPVEVTTVVTIDPTTRPTVQPAVWPTAATTGQDTALTISVRPIGTVQGPVTLTWPGGTTALTDDGHNGDLAAGDHVWSKSITWRPTTEGLAPFTVSAQVDGTAKTGTTSVVVYPPGIPTKPEVLSKLNILTEGESSFLADRIVLITANEVTADQLKAAATSVSGTIAGHIADSTWQVAIPPVRSRAQLDAAIKTISRADKVITAEPDFLASPTHGVRPNDVRFDEQHNLRQVHIDEAWVFQHGRSESPIVIAIIDSGIFLGFKFGNIDFPAHPDLKPRLLPGKDFADGDDDVNDTVCGHGTNVAGVAAAAGDNGEGITGVNWNARILPIKVMPDRIGCPPNPKPEERWPISALVSGIDYAVDHGASVLNISLIHKERAESEAKALEKAGKANRAVVAGAGNSGKEERLYPAAYDRHEDFEDPSPVETRIYTLDVLGVGNVDANGHRHSSSTFNSWIDIAAPGVNVLVADTARYNYYSRVNGTGTSIATPHVTGVISLMLSENPGLSTTDIRSRLIATGRPLNEKIGPILDGYEAVANGSFESGISPWLLTGTGASTPRYGPITPRVGKQMLLLSTGPDTSQMKATLRRTIQVPADRLIDNELHLRLFYNYVTEEYPEFVGSKFNDLFTIDIVLPDGTRQRMVNESVNTTAWTPVSGIDLPGGDETVGQSGWRTADLRIPADKLHGATSFDILVTDVGDAIYDSVALIDGIQVLPSGSCVPPGPC
jgi:subtilisin family serine protease